MPSDRLTPTFSSVATLPMWQLIRLTNTVVLAWLLCWIAPVLLSGTVSECSAAHWPLTQPSVGVVSISPPSLPAYLPRTPLWYNTLSGVNTHTHSHPTLPSSVTVRADSSGRQADEWRLGLLPERLHDNGPVGPDRETKTASLPHTRHSAPADPYCLLYN